jgi:hypothetical protein
MLSHWVIVYLLTCAMPQKVGTLCYNAAEASNLIFFCRYRITLSPRIDILKNRGGGKLDRRISSNITPARKIFREEVTTITPNNKFSN